MRTDNPPLLELYRGGVLESLHRGAWVMVDTAGTVVEHRGDPEQDVYARSAMKSLQALPLIESGAVDRFGFDDRHLALALASHSGQSRHLDVAADGLSRIGLTAAALQCGPQRPMHSDPSVEPTQLANNCSGKHIGFLATCLHLGQDPSRYLDPSGPTQQAVRSSVESMIGVPIRSDALDGCSAPTFAMPLRSLAAGLALLANPSRLDNSRAEACRRLTEAARARPDLIAGTHERFCTDLAAATDGRIFAKIGAEGVYVFGAVGEGLGFAGKVDDGNARGLYRVMLELLTRRGLLTAGEVDSLEHWASSTIRNWAGRVVGSIEVSRD